MREARQAKRGGGVTIGAKTQHVREAAGSSLRLQCQVGRKRFNLIPRAKGGYQWGLGKHGQGQEYGVLSEPRHLNSGSTSWGGQLRQASHIS